MTPKKPFTLYARKTKKKKPVFYVKFKKIDGTYSTAMSTGETSRIRAEAWAYDYLQKKGAPMPGRDVSLEDFSRDFFLWTGHWATDRKAEGKRISERHCMDREAILRNHVLPVFGKCKLTEINKALIKNFRNDLYIKGFSSSVIKKCIYTIGSILTAAEDQEIVQAVPKLPGVSNTAKPKGVLTVEEVRKLFSFPWTTTAAYCHPERPEFMAYIGNLVAASTGLRIGKLQAILIKDLHLNDGYISVERSWDTRLNKLNKTTKTGRARNIFIPSLVVAAIRELLLEHPAPDDPEAFLFFSGKRKNEKPAEQVFFTKALYRAMERIGIDEIQRRARRISFHSHRYFCNSLLINAKIPIQKVQAITGHVTAEMSQHYYHVDDMSDVRAVQEGLFPALREPINPDPGGEVTH